MAKRARKLSMRHEKNQGGCIWSLVSKLHSRDGRSTRKLLLAGRGISRSNSDSMTVYDANVQDSADGERTEFITAGGKPSIKTLMEEEMIIEANAESRQRKNRSKTSKRGKTKPKESDDRVTDDSNEQCLADDVRDSLEYLGNLFQQRSRICEEHDEEEFVRAIGKVLSWQLGSGKQLTKDEKLRHSKVFVSMLRILNSAEFSLLDREVMLTKCMEILYESQLERSLSKKSIKGNIESSSESRRIVILKHRKALNVGISREIETIGGEVQKTKPGAPSFLSNIKRKFKTIVAKECPVVSADNSDLYTGKVTFKLAGIKIEDNSKHESARVSFRAKKYLSEALTDEDNEDMSNPGQNPEIMGMILLYPELNSSPQVSPGRKWEYGAVNSPTGSPSRTKNRIVCEKWRKPESARRKETDTCAFMFLGQNAASSAANGDFASTSSYANGSAGNMNKEWHEREQRPTHRFPSPKMSLIIEERNDDSEVATDSPERPSPISVLEPLFSDDDISPAIIKQVEFPRQLLEIEVEEDDICITEADVRVRTSEADEELVLEQVRALLQASNLKWEDLYLKSPDSDRIIEPSLLRDQHLLKDDTKLLVDCLNEALSEACACFVGRCCLPLVKQRIKPVPSMNFTIHEACRAVKWHLHPIPPPCSLEQIVGKDLSRRAAWMDLTFEGEGIGFEVSERIFSELLQDIIVSSADEGSKGAYQLKIRQPSSNSHNST